MKTSVERGGSEGRGDANRKKGGRPRARVGGGIKGVERGCARARGWGGTV